MSNALLKITLREWQRHKLRLALTVLGIALGVAVFFAVRTTNQTLVNSLHDTVEKLAGKATLQVAAGETGFPEEILQRVRSTIGVENAEPLTETIATTALGEKLLILGLDSSSDLKIYDDSFDQGNVTIKNPLAFASRDDSVAVTRSFADRFGLKEGDRVTIDVQSGRRELTIRGLFSASGSGSVFNGNVAVMDLAAAQAAFGKKGRIDRIDVVNTRDVETGELQRRLTEWLPSGVRAVRPDMRGQSLENSFSSMQYGLTMMSSLALIIGVFIIFNSFSISLNQRWKEIGILRSLGVTRGGVQRMFLVEAALKGIIGSAIGVVAGFGLARVSMQLVGDVMARFYGFGSVTGALEYDLNYAAQGVLAGIVTSLVAAWIPARAASTLDPALALHNIESRRSESGVRLPRLVGGLLMVGVGVGFTLFGLASIGFNLQLLYSFVILLGMIMLVPAFTRIGAWAIKPVMSRIWGAEGLIAVETLANSPRRTSSTVIALMTGLAFVFSHEAYITSQKAAMNRMLDRALAADLLVTSSTEIRSHTYHYTEEMAGRIAALPEVAVADPIRLVNIQYDGQEVGIVSHDMDAYFAISPELLDSGDSGEARAATARGEAMLVSNNFATRWTLRLGDVVTLDTPGGPLSLPIAGMLDYWRSEKGTIFFDRELFKKYWGDSDVDYIFLDLKPSVDRDALKAKIENALLGEQRAFIFTHDEYRVWVGHIVDRFFALVYVQMGIAFLVAVIGLVNTMVISVAERRRELGIFRAIGGLRRQVAKIVLLEAVAISIIGFLTGTLAGFFLALFLVNTAARVVGAFTLPLIFPLSMVLIAIPIVIVTALVSAWFPARSASRLNVVEAIGYE